jgi:enamine deaminase RidA (YjgF/YER057c/UK114 family)
MMHFETIAEARVAAQVTAPQRRRKWSRTRVIEELRRLRRRRRLKFTIVGLTRVGYSGLVRAASVYVGSLRRACRLAGIPDPASGGYKRELWDDDRVIHEIRLRHRANLTLARSKAPTKLVSAAVDHCGGWREAIEMAGLDYDKIRLNRAPWRKEEVLASLREAGRAVGAGGLGPDLSKQARRLFGDPQSAVVAAGLDPEAVLYRQHRTRRELATELHRLARERPTMTLTELQGLKVGAAAMRRYGGLPEALDRLGIRGWPRRAVTPLPSREELLRALHARRRRGDSMVQQDIGRDEPRLARAAYKHFGSLRAAMQAAGLRAIGKQRWSDEVILEEIRRRHRKGLPLADSKAAPKLRSAAIEHFGTWERAIEKAGLDYHALRLVRTPSNRAKVIAELRVAATSGRRGIGAEGFASAALADQARRAFGSLRAAARAAGLDPAHVLLRQDLTDRELATALRRLVREQPKMTMTAFQRSTIGGMAIRRHGSLAAAIDAVGARGWPRRLRQPLPSREELLRGLQHRHKRGASMRQLAVGRGERRLLKAALKHFGTWGAAMRAAGLGALVGGGGERWTKAKILAALRARHASGKPLNTTTVKRDEPRLLSAVHNHFGSMPRALAAARLPLPVRRSSPERIPASQNSSAARISR